MNTFAFRVGAPEEDALWLVSGFSDAHQFEGVSWRNCSKVFRLHVPLAASGATRVTLRMRFVDMAFHVTIRAGDDLACEIEPKGSGWNDYAFTLGPADTPVTLTGELDRDPYDPPKPRLEPNRTCVDLSQVTVESVDGADVVVPQELTRRRTAQPPLAITNFRTSANVVRKKPADSGEKTVFFGDIHVHTNYSVCGRPNNGTLEENVAAAKERGLDFIAITDHCEHMDLDAWRRYFEEIETCSRKYDILIVPATEWTSRDHGHRNIYFLRGNPPYFDYFQHETDHPNKLGAFFKKHSLDAFAVPHHFPYVFQSGNVDSIAPEIEPLIEIYSTWGSSESYGARLQDTSRIMPGCTVKDALARGLKLGFVGGGDVHNGVPGDGGLAAVIAEELTLENIFRAMKSRLCYATSGARILLDFQINGFPMGSVLTVNQYSIDKLFPLDIAASGVCSVPADRMELICNGEVIHASTHRTSASKGEMGLRLSIEKLSTPAGRTNSLNQQLVNHSRYYYVRVVQSDGGMAWSSPIWVDYQFEPS